MLKAIILVNDNYYMQGETNVTEQQLDSFLSSAQELQVNDDHCDDCCLSKVPFIFNISRIAALAVD